VPPPTLLLLLVSEHVAAASSSSSSFPFGVHSRSLLLSLVTLAITLELPWLSKLADAHRLVLITDGLQPIPGHNQHRLHLQPARQVARVSLFIHMQNGDETLNPKTLDLNPKPGVFIHTPNEIQTASHRSYLGVTCYFFASSWNTFLQIVCSLCLAMMQWLGSTRNYHQISIEYIHF